MEEVLTPQTSYQLIQIYVIKQNAIKQEKKNKIRKQCLLISILIKQKVLIYFVINVVGVQLLIISITQERLNIRL